MLTPSKPRRIRPWAVLIAVTVALLMAGNIISLAQSSHTSAKAANDAATSKQLTERLAADEATSTGDQARLNAKQATSDYRTCLRVNGVVDSVFSLVDRRSPSRQSAELVLASPSATAVQRASAELTIHNNDLLLALLKGRFTTEKCAIPKVSP